MCQHLEGTILTDALNGDVNVVAAAAAGMTPAERQAFRKALAEIVRALGHDCTACDGVIPTWDQMVSRGPMGGPYDHYHPGCVPDAGQQPS